MPKRHSRPSDLYRNAHTRVIWDGITISRVTVVGPLHRSTEVVEFREGGDASTVKTSPGKNTWAPFVIRRVVSNDNEFENWANLTTVPGPGLGNFRKTIRVELFIPAGRVVRAYTLHRCWVQSYEAMPTRVNGRRELLFETLTLRYDGWDRDTTIVG
jgi:phage tail-like protein